MKDAENLKKKKKFCYGAQWLSSNERQFFMYRNFQVVRNVTLNFAAWFENLLVGIFPEIKSIFTMHKKNHSICASFWFQTRVKSNV